MHVRRLYNSARKVMARPPSTGVLRNTKLDAPVQKLRRWPGPLLQASRFLTAVRRSVRLRFTLAPRIARAVHAEGLTYVDVRGLRDLFQRVRELDRQGREGILIEAGCALGGSAIVIGAARTRPRRLDVYDVFGMIPPPSERDDADVHARYAVIANGKSRGIAGKTYYGYEPDLLKVVEGNFRRHGIPAESVRFIEGRFEDTLQVNEPVALAHIDADWYDSVMTCLQRIVPHLVSGGVIVIDDYDDWSGCHKAVDDYFAGRKHEFEFVRRARLHVVRR